MKQSLSKFRRIPATSVAVLIGMLTVIVFAAPPTSNQAGKTSAENASRSSNSTAAVSAPAKAPISLGLRRKELRDELQKRSRVRPEKPTIPLGKPADYWHAFKQYEAAAQNPKAEWALVSQHLRLAEALFEQDDPAVRRSAVGVLLLATNCTSQRLKDPVLAARICDAWLLPHLDDASANATDLTSRHNVAKQATAVFFQAGDFERMAVAADHTITHAENLNAGDYGRMRLAQALDGQGKTEEAIRTLREISNPSMSGVKQMIEQLSARPAGGKDVPLKK